MKKFKRLTAVLLSLVLMMSVVSVSAFATSLSEGLGAIKENDFVKGYGPKTNGYELQYGLFAPKSNNVKHPLVVFTGGTGANNSKDAEWKGNSFPLWASDEYQSRFQSGGAYLLFVRAPEPAEWDLVTLIKPLKATVDDVCKKNPNIDKTKIYYVGWCLGCPATWRMLGSYPDEVAGIVCCSAFYAPTSSEIKAAADKPVWLLGCTKDLTASYNLYTGSTWNSLKKVAKDKTKIRLTKYSSSYSSDKTNHEMWVDACYDMFYSGLSGVTTDGNGTVVELKNPEKDGMIQWISRFSSPKEEEPTQPDIPVNPDNTCTCACHSTGFAKLIWKIRVFFYSLFGMSKYRECACGEMHW